MTTNTTTFSDINALFINTSLKKKARESHTRLLLEASANIMLKQGVKVEQLHFAGYAVAPGSTRI